MSERLNAAATALAETAVIDGPMDPEDVARIALDAADAVMFSEEAIERAAEALATADGRIWSVLGPITKEQYRAFVRAVVAALRGEA